MFVAFRERAGNRFSVVCTVATAASLLAASASRATEPAGDIDWHKVSGADVCGKGWSDVRGPFDRLPARAEQVVRPPVWELAQHSTGLYVDFETDARAVSVRWTLTSERLAMPHMPATGVSGVDFYLLRGGEWHFLATGQPRQTPTNTVQLTRDVQVPDGKYRLYLPLYNGVSEVAVGISKGANFNFVENVTDRGGPVVIYGTSITQGGCASRPGMSYPAILGRRLNLPVVNLGFSGNGKAEPEVAEFLAELNARVFVVDPLPNLFPEQVGERLPAFIGIIRTRHPKTPILLMESPLFPDVPYSATRDQRVRATNDQLRGVLDSRVAAGDHNIWILPAVDLTTDGGDGTVDGIHPTDVGFLRMADVVETHLRNVLAMSGD